MNHHYADIRNRIDLEPLWWDENAVPRYCDFAPNHTANIYADEVVLLKIRCQGCNRPFRVVMSDHQSRRIIKASLSGDETPLPTLRESVETKTIHYGDPPNIGCCPAGPSMNSVPDRVLEFWAKGKQPMFAWERVTELEVDVEPEWATDDD